MKKFYLALILILTVSGTFSQVYTYTAKKNGNWNDVTVWNIAPRPAATKSKVIIPAAFTVAVDNGVNSFGLGDVEINLLGTLTILNSTTINLSPASTFEIMGPGKIVGSNATQLVTLGGVVKYDGSKDGTKAGGWIAGSFTGISPIGFVSTAVLPVTLVSFNATKNNSEVLLKWITAAEVSNEYFLVERSKDGLNWASIGKVKGSVNSNANAVYSYSDKNATGPVSYYRLKQVDNKGSYTYSEVKKVATTAANTAKIYLVNNILKVELTNIAENATVTVVQSGGRIVNTKTFSGLNTLSLNLPITGKGILFVNVSDNKDLNETSGLLF